MPDKKRPKVDSPATGKDAKKAKSDKKESGSESKESFNYDPVHFIRSHSKNNDPADIQTQIWEVDTILCIEKLYINSALLYTPLK